MKANEVKLEFRDCYALVSINNPLAKCGGIELRDCYALVSINKNKNKGQTSKKLSSSQERSDLCFCFCLYPFFNFEDPKHHNCTY